MIGGFTGVFDLFNSYLRQAVGLGASDIHLSAGCPIRFRVKGRLQAAQDSPVLGPTDTKTIAEGILLAAKKAPADRVHHVVESLYDLNCSYALPQVSRFRVNICSQRGTLSLVLRMIPFDLPSIEDLGLPKVLKDIALEDWGLILVTGVTGSGKSSTLTAMINHINANRRGKIVTIEDPIEYLHRDNQCSVIQRELGSDTESFSVALRASLRQDPDVILVGELRDRETIDLALKAAETGHTVFSSMHTTDAPKTISRLVNVFDANEPYNTRLRLAESLKAVISQRLLPRKGGIERIVAVEIMRQTREIQDCILSPEKTQSIRDFIEMGRDHYGMQSFDQHLKELYLADLITLDVARHSSSSSENFEQNLVK